MKKTGITWDSVSIQNVIIKDLRNDSFDIFREQAIKSKRMDELDIQISNEQLLEHLNLINEGLLTRAGILLFHHNPEKWIPYVKIAYFQSESDILYQDEVHGSLLSQADKVVDLIYTKYLKGIISYQNITKVETYPYPKEAIREAVLNAISHKNYATLVPIQIRVYDDRIMVANDCVFPDDWTVDDLMGTHKSRPYNPLIANTFFRAGFIEAWGRGIQKIKDSCALAGNDIPEYKVKREDITIIFKSLYNKNTQDNTQDRDLTNKEKQILSICKEEKSKQEIANLMGYKTIKSIKLEVESLLSKGKLRMSIPDKPKSKNQKYIATKEYTL